MPVPVVRGSLKYAPLIMALNPFRAISFSAPGMLRGMNRTKPITARIPIWSPGEYVSLAGETFAFADGDLAATADAYSPAKFRAPWVKGHPKVADPAYGWADGLEWDGHYLWADSGQIDAEFADEVRAGRWGKISPTFFPPNHPDNPQPGIWYLKNIGWLGAHAPANKQLPSPAFAEQEEGLVNFEHSISADLAEFSESPDRQEESTMPDNDDREAQFAEREQTLNTREADLTTRENALHGREAAAHLVSCAEFAESYVKSGQVLPAWQAGLTAFLANLPEDQEVEFAEGDETVRKPSAAWFRSFIEALPVQVEFGEHAAGGGKDTEVVEFAAPQGYTVDKTRADLHSKAVAYQQQHPEVDYATAVAKVS